MSTMTYQDTGVDYSAMDPFKRACQMAARETSGNILRLNGGEFRGFDASRGESAYLIEAAKSYFAHVEEGLGTKNLVADAMYLFDGNKSYYDQIAQDTVAMIVNDMITVGALPLSVAMHLAVGTSGWFEEKQRWQELIDGWQKACNMARCVWGGGETPTLKDVVIPDRVVLSGSAMGIVKPKERLLVNKIKPGDAIVIIESSGIHANGLTLARKIADKLPEGYITKLSGGRLYGEALLDPTIIYVGLIEACFDEGVDLHAAVNITGHGWRKLMRAVQPFTYVIEKLPKPLPIFDFLREHGPIDEREAYGNLNMGAGFALYVNPDDVTKVCELAASLDYRAFDGGYIEAGEKQVVIKPKGLVYKCDTLEVR